MLLPRAPHPLGELREDATSISWTDAERRLPEYGLISTYRDCEGVGLTVVARAMLAELRRGMGLDDDGIDGLPERSKAILAERALAPPPVKLVQPGDPVTWRKIGLAGKFAKVNLGISPLVTNS
jgi:hypothetical protein